MLTHEQRQLIHEDFVKATELLGTTYRAYEQLINAESKQQAGTYDQLRQGTGTDQEFFKCIETCVVSDNYFRSVSGLPPAPYPECQPIQSALEQNSPEYLMSLA